MHREREGVRLEASENRTGTGRSLGHRYVKFMVRRCQLSAGSKDVKNTQNRVELPLKEGAPQHLAVAASRILPTIVIPLQAEELHEA